MADTTPEMRIFDALKRWTIISRDFLDDSGLPPRTVEIKLAMALFDGLANTLVQTDMMTPRNAGKVLEKTMIAVKATFKMKKGAN